ncbi:MAG TPA: DUF3825 domain-containing protein, partial [Bacteroidia bacterium]|nr:DUF3825 domain-containing protein [Bacteroidia bacterium]
MKNDKYDLPEHFHQFAFAPRFDDNIKFLANFIEEEDWKYHNTPSDTEYPILENYIKYTYKRLAEEKKVAYSKEDTHACLNTGLVTRNQEPVYMVFEKNNLDDTEPYWHFYKFIRKGEWELSKFPSLPEMAFYFDNPAKLV